MVTCVRSPYAHTTTPRGLGHSRQKEIEAFGINVNDTASPANDCAVSSIATQGENPNRARIQIQGHRTTQRQL
jgi:hypothetical protein